MKRTLTSLVLAVLATVAVVGSAFAHAPQSNGCPGNNAPGCSGNGKGS